MSDERRRAPAGVLVNAAGDSGPTGPASSAAPAEARSVRAVRAIVFLAREFEHACREIGVSLSQYRLLLFLRHGPRRAGELAARMMIKRPTLTALVANLEREGRLRRRAVAADGRGITLELTPEGLTAMERAEARLAALIGELAGAGDREAILATLDQIARILDRQVEQRFNSAQ